MRYKNLFKYNWVILILLISFFAVTQESKASTAKEAIARYEAGEFKLALNIFDSLYKSGSQHSDICYNIGNCYFRLDELGMAILFYERAHALSPQKADVLNNLELCRSLRVDSYDSIPRSFLATFLDY